ncbi:carbon-nitrogen hydrolase [Pyronema omphalodes]|nr:carbon-nitrogen hydrolase [Pyronema omphalodes]
MLLRRLLNHTTKQTFFKPLRPQYRTMSAIYPACTLKEKVKVALCQFAAGTNKQANLDKASELVSQAAKNDAKIVVLPECFNSPYGTSHFANYAEAIPEHPTEEQSPTFHRLASLALQHKIYLFGGSIPEADLEDPGKYYNTCLIFGPDGNFLQKHRKVHLFDIDIPNEMTFKESDVLSPGKHITMVETRYGPVAVGICYDIRFAEMAMVAARKGAALLLYPGAFSKFTGELHWELLARARAVDNQIFVGVCSPARAEEGYIAWGESMLVDCKGQVLSKAGTGEEIVYAELDPENMENTRSHIPIRTQRRMEVYGDLMKVVPADA